MKVEKYIRYFNLILKLVLKCQTWLHKHYCDTMIQSKICHHCLAIMLAMITLLIKKLTNIRNASVSGCAHIWQSQPLQEQSEPVFHNVVTCPSLGYRNWLIETSTAVSYLGHSNTWQHSFLGLKNLNLRLIKKKKLQVWKRDVGTALRVQQFSEFRVAKTYANCITYRVALSQLKFFVVTKQTWKTGTKRNVTGCKQRLLCKGQRSEVLLSIGTWRHLVIARHKCHCFLSLLHTSW